jgi:hypothetical protein
MGPPTADLSIKGPQPGVFLPDASALPHRLIGNPPERPHSTPIVSWQDNQQGRDGNTTGTNDRLVRETQTVPPEGTAERRSGGMAIMSLLNNVNVSSERSGVKPSSVASDATEDEAATRS